MPVSPARARQSAAAQHTPTPLRRWRAWFRTQWDQHWRVLCEAADYDSAWSLLLDRMPRVNGDAVVLEGERVP